MAEEVMTLRQIIDTTWLAEGNTGPASVEFIREFRAANSTYGRWPLGTQFRSGSDLAMRPVSSLDDATAKWNELHPGVPPTGDEFERLYAATKFASDALEKATKPEPKQ